MSYHNNALALAALTSGVLFIAGCGGNQSSGTPTPSAHSTSTPTPSASPSADAPLVKAVSDWSLAFDSAVRAMNPDDPGLPATATGNQLVHDLTTLHSWQIQGITAKGDLPRVLDGHVETMTAKTAV